MWKFLGLDPELAREATGWSLQFVSPWPLWVAALVVVAGVAYVYQLYRREAQPLRMRDRIVFTALRTAAVLILLVMISEPVVMWDLPAEKDASLVVLLDDSQSMGVTDSYEGSLHLGDVARLMWPEEMGRWTGNSLNELPAARRDAMKVLTRAGILNRLLAQESSNFLLPASEMFHLNVNLFSDELKPVATGGEPKAEGVTSELLKLRVVPEGPITRAGDLLRQAVVSARSRVAGVLLVSDGAVNVGEDLDSTARFLKERRVPVYCVGIGDARPLHDVSVRNFHANRIVLLNDIVTVDFELESQGFRGKQVTVKLLRDEEPVTVLQEGRPVASADFLLEEKKAEKDGEEVPLPEKCRLGFRADRAGEFTYKLLVEPRLEELITQNNSVSLPIRVVQNKIRVLYIEGTPRWEYRYLKNALVRDETIDVSCFLFSSDFDFPQEGDIPIAFVPTKEEELAPYDVIIMGDVPRNALTDAQLSLFHRFVEKLGGGFLMQAGMWYAPRQYQGTVIEKMLPVDLTGAVTPSEGTTQEWRPVLTVEGETHPMTRFEADVAANRALWQQLPGFFWHYPVSRARPAALVLLEHPTERSAYGPEPLLATQFYGSGKTAFFAVDSTWRWRGLVGDRYFSRFWGQVIRDLSQGKFIGTSKRFRVATDRSEYRAGEKVAVTARVLDRDFEPSRASEIRARVEGGPENVTFIKLDPVVGESGNFRGSATLNQPGSYRVTLDLVEPGIDLSSVSHQFLVVRSRLEFLDPRMRRDELKRLADITGGRYFDVQEAGKVPAVIERLKAATVREVPNELWNAPAFFTLFCCLFLTELLYRKLCKLL